MAQQMSQQIKNQIIHDLKQIQKQSSQIPNEQLIKMDFSKLPQRQINLLDKLSFFSSHRRIFKVLTDQYGSYKQKQRYISENINILTTDESVDFTRNKQFFRTRTFLYPTYITSFFTVGAFMVALWTLPSRMSTVKYTLIGLTAGVVTSYGFWRYSMVQYYSRLNRLFGVVTYESYKMEKGQRK